MTNKERLKDLLDNAKDIVASDPKSSLKNVLELYSELKEGNDYESIGKLCKLIGTIYLKNAEYQQAVEYYTQGIANFKLTGNYTETGNIYNNLVIASFYLDAYDKVEEYSNLAMVNYGKAASPDGVISVANNLAKYYKSIKAFDKAYQLLKNTLRDYEHLMDRERKNVLWAGYANASINNGNVEEGLKILFKLDQECKQGKEYQAITLIKLYLAEYYESVDDYKSALENYKEMHTAALLDSQEDVSAELNRYLTTFNIDVDRVQYDRMVKQNEDLIKAHSKIIQKNGFLETMINTIPLPLFYCNLDNYYLGCNDAFAKYLNLSKKDIIGKKFGFTLIKEEHPYYTNLINELIENDSPMHAMAKLTKTGNDVRNIELFYSLFNGEDGELAGVLGMLKDVTQEHKQQLEIKDLNAHLKSVLESASQVYICSIDRDYNYRYFNKNYLEAVKRHYRIVVKKGSSYFERYSSQSEISEKHELLDKVFAGEVNSGIREYVKLNHSEILQYFYSPIIDEDGQIIGATAFSYDITDRVLAQKELALSNQTKDKFFSIIAHDLRSPIGNIKSALELITGEEKLPNDEKSEMLEMLYGSAVNTYDLLENLLQWSLTQRGLLENNATSYQLTSLLEETIKLSRNIAHSKNVEIKMNCSPEIKVFVDKDMFYTVLRNLLNNAIKYSYKKSKIRVEVEGDPNFVLIKIVDQGVGIKKEVIPYLNQMEKTVTTYGTAGEKGSGLGLVLCHELVEKLGGKIWVESQEGKGSTFSFTIPTEERY